MGNFKEILNGYKESFGNMEEMMRRFLQPQKENQVEATASISQATSVDLTNVASLFRGKWLKVDVPRFNGIDAEDWVFKIKEFFKVYGVPEEQRIKVASFHMEGPASHGISE